MDTISPIAWVIIILFGLFIIGLNYGLVVALRDGKGFQLPKPKGGRADQTIKNASDMLRKPFAEEQDQLNELAGLVNRLKQPPKEDQEKAEKT